MDSRELQMRFDRIERKLDTLLACENIALDDNGLPEVTPEQVLDENEEAEAEEVEKEKSQKGKIKRNEQEE